ncbi:MAG TPA: hypothetical protein GXZ52_01120 [Clostridiales bacterium]|nr:hypothetical protein [Clostridiales bacterium]
MENGYRAYSVYLTYTPKEVGAFEVNDIVFTTSRGEQLTYPLGSITFVIDNDDSGLINTWEVITTSCLIDINGKAYFY